MLRHLGLAARFVSGYLIQLTADEKPLDGPSGPERDFTDLHAWAEVYLPGAGWIGLDPTSRPARRRRPHSAGLHRRPEHRRAGDRLFAWTRPARRDDKCEEVSAFDMSVTRVHEDPRVTKPYTDDAVAGDRRAGRARRRRSGRERRAPDAWAANRPSCRSTTCDGAEWNFTALGPDKRELADALLSRLRDRFAPRRTAAFRPGQVVSGRVAAALGAGLLLAARRRAVLAGRRRCSPTRARLRQRCAAGCAGFRHRASPTALGAARHAGHPRLRGRAEAAQAKKRRCRSTSIRCAPI